MRFDVNKLDNLYAELYQTEEVVKKLKNSLEYFESLINRIKKHIAVLEAKEKATSVNCDSFRDEV